ncbi:MAG: hypothetical protein ABEN55_14880 [Bradymonadaceae bacterium]
MMSKDCNIRLEIDGDSPPVVEDTEPITGTLYVEVGEEVQCNGLMLTQKWETHGKGNTDSGQGHRVALFEQEQWRPGQSYEYPFEMKLPPGPYTYRGHYINIDWTLEASADFPWALDPSAERDFVLEPGGRDNYVPGHGDTQDLVADEPGGQAAISWIGLLFSLVFVAAGLGVGYMGIAQSAGFGAVAFALAFIGGGLFGVYMSIRNYFAEMQLGDVEVEMHPDVAIPGDELECRFRMAPQQTVDLERATVQLTGKEQATYGHGTDSTTYTQTIHDETAVPEDSVDTQLQPNGPKEFVTTLPVPDSAPYTFDTSDNDIQWQIVFKLEIPTWPDWSHTEKILVRPATESRDAAPADEQPDQPTQTADKKGTEEAYAETW